MSNARELAKAGGSIGAGGFVGMKNRIINGAMVIDQRNAGASVTPTDGRYTLDRYETRVSQASKLTIQQSSVTPVGFTKSLLVTSSSAYSVTASDYFAVCQSIEGFNAADFGWGTASAQTVTLSFWVRSSLTGTFGGSFSNGSNRFYPFTYTINAANTWEQKSVTLVGDTTGTWVTDNGKAIQLSFGLGCGATFSSTAGAWNGTSGYFSATGATSVVGTNGATFYITGVQLEKGPQATPFEFRHYGTELALCQRYYVTLGAISGGYAITIGRGMSNGSNSGWRTLIQVPGPMRATPSLTPYNLLGWNLAGPVGLSSFSTVYLVNGLCLEADINYVSSVGPASAQVYLQTNGSGGPSYLAVSAEL